MSLGSTFTVDSEDPEQWAEAIKRVRQKGSETAIQECQELRTQYAEKYSWNRQTKELLSIMLSSFNGDDDLRKREEMYEYPPSKQTLSPRPITPPPIRPSESEASSKPSSFIPERRYTGERVQSTKPDVPVESKVHRISDQGARPKEKGSSNIETIKDLKGDISKKEEMSEYQPPKQTLPPRPIKPQPVRPSDSEAFSRPSSSLPAERLYAGERVQSTKPVVPVESRAHRISGQGARPKENSSSNTVTKDLVILGCSVSEGSMRAVMQEIKNIGPNLNVKKEPPVKNLPPAQIKQYLERNWTRLCVLVMDTVSVKYAYENLPKLKYEYEDLLKTAVDRVAEKIIILVCDSLPLTHKDEETVHQTIYRIFKERNKGFIAWLKNGKLTVDSDVLVQFLRSSKPTMGHMMPQGRRPEESQGQSNVPSFSATEFHHQTYVDQSRRHVVHSLEPETRYGLKKPNMQQPQVAIQQSYPPANTTNTGDNPSTGKPVFKSKLRYGIISYKKEDIELYSSEFQGIPHETTQNLLQSYGCTPEIQVKVMSDPKDNTVLQVVIGSIKNKGIQLADNETLVLQTRVRNGLISDHEDDVEFRYPGWSIPVHLLEDVKRKAYDGKLFIISNDKGNLRCKIESAGVKDKAKIAGRLSSFFKNEPF